MTARERLLRIGRRQGPCALCGIPALARHRLWDSVDGFLRGGATAASLSEEFSMAPREVRWVKDAYAEARRKHWPLPGRAEW